MTRPGPAYACVSAANEVRTIAGVLHEVMRCPDLDGALVLVNGSTDGTAEAARRALGRRPPGREPSFLVQIRELPEPLGHDVGRAVTAAWALETGAAVLLFLDADFPVAPRDVSPFVRAVRDGADVALNHLSDLVTGWAALTSTAAAQSALNALVDRPDLGLDSLVAVPHALSRTAVEVLGPTGLCVPPLGQVRAILGGLTVVAPHTVNTITLNRPSPLRPRLRSRREMVELLLGDHLEALAEVIGRRGPRGGFADHGRRRSHTADGPRQD